jgi:hypothetical protein
MIKKSEIMKISKIWVSYNSESNPDSDAEDEYFTVLELMDRMLKDSPLCLLETIQSIYELKFSINFIPTLAAGPLEDLIKLENDSVTEAILEIAKTDKRMQFMLGGVWYDFPNSKYYEEFKKYSMPMNEENYFKLIQSNEIN